MNTSLTLDKEKLMAFADEFFAVDEMEEAINETFHKDVLTESIFMNNHFISKGTPYEIISI